MRTLLIILVLLFSCEREYVIDPFIGTWSLDNSDTKLTFYNGTGFEDSGFGQKYFTWGLTNKLTITWEEGRSQVYDYEITKNKLMLEGVITYYYTRDEVLR